MYIIASMHGQTWASCKQTPAISGKNNVHSQRQQHGAPQLAVAWVFGGLCSFPSTELLTNTSGPVREPGKTRKQIRKHREKQDCGTWNLNEFVICAGMVPFSKAEQYLPLPPYVICSCLRRVPDGWKVKWGWCQPWIMSQEKHGNKPNNSAKQTQGWTE
jgi:hypothetical protein